MLAAIAHHLITVLFVYTMIGSVVWMLVYTQGYLAGVYGEPSGSGRLVDGFADILITLILILGWPGMLGMLLHKQRRVRR